MSLSYRNQLILVYWFLYDRDLRHERVNLFQTNFISPKVKIVTFFDVSKSSKNGPLMWNRLSKSVQQFLIKLCRSNRMPGIVNLSKFGKKDLIFIQCGLFFKPDMPALLWKINSRKYFREFLNFAVIFRYKLFGVTRLNFLVVGKTLPQICQNKCLFWPVFSRIRIELYLIKGSVLLQEKRVKKIRILACLTQYYNVKSVRIRNFSGPYFPAFELNTER